MRNTQGAGPPVKEQDWLDAARDGDVDAFGRIYDRHVRAVFRYAISIVRDVGDAEDVTQDVFLLAWTRRADIRIVDVSVLPWLLVTARNVSMNRLRQRTKAPNSLEIERERPAAGPTPEDSAARRQLAVMIRSAVDQLSVTDQRLYRLCLVDGLSYEEAATGLGTTHGVVRNRLTRLRRTLRGRLATDTEGLL
ncbi:RNA polymerase sigma factor [Frondihabitans sp. 762G35]|uniref:RNA polymerase sigma factor n=1 Tax=Frondihabitans sp. 762G35 TaxID=1446794 RepID=UPI000E706685|nr:sigma-70 family RNA polymerase sigma factor [Frondihabitans sp. 762G35]